LIVTPSNNILYLFYVIHLQKDGYETVEEINNLNGELYRAFASLSREKMEKLWKHAENVVCIHPGWDLFMGWLAIRESCITIFSNTEMIRFTIKNSKIRIFDNKLAVVVCVENIKTTGVDGPIIRIGGIATNVFERNESNQCCLFIIMVLL
jgi:hypothetical protein